MLSRVQANYQIDLEYRAFLTPAKKAGTFICPLCGNGTGDDGDGMAINNRDRKKIHLKCFKCGFYGDIVDLMQKARGYSSYMQTLEALADELNIVFEKDKPNPIMEARQAIPQPPPEVEKDYTEYFQQMTANLDGAAEYLSSRGISMETARRFMLGYDMRYKAGGDMWRALIIPTSRTSYVARNTDRNADKSARYRKTGKISLFNAKALQNAEKRPVFITEGELDALSIIEAGGLACALGSTANAGKLAAYLKDNPTESVLLLALDNDEAGWKATADLEEKLTGQHFAKVDIYGDSKDANEELTRDPAGLRDAIRAEEAKNKPGAAMILSFLQAISGRQYEPAETGLAPLDKLLCGGFLRQSLIMMGAAPGMGKSFFAQQLFEGMAQKGHNVLYFNLEMSREQMLARSFARLARVRENSTMAAIDILQGYKWTQAQRETVERTARAYMDEYAPHIAYNPAGSTADLDAILSQMEAAAERAKEAGIEAPLVVIDYLHLLRGNGREDVQTTVKRAVDAFKGYAMRYNSIVFCILAFNRESNKGGKVTQESGRDSSAIEYSGDLMLGLNYAKVEENTDSELADKIREAAQQEGDKAGFTDYKLKVLKNRLQGIRGSIDLSFWGRYGLFLPKVDEPSQMRIIDADLPFMGKRI